MFCVLFLEMFEFVSSLSLFLSDSRRKLKKEHQINKKSTAFPDLLSPGAAIAGVLDGGDEGGQDPVAVKVTTKGIGEDKNSSSLLFYLERCSMGRRKGSWLVAAIHRRGGE